jgi:hypothetical protein
MLRCFILWHPWHVVANVRPYKTARTGVSSYHHRLSDRDASWLSSRHHAWACSQQRVRLFSPPSGLRRKIHIPSQGVKLLCAFDKHTYNRGARRSASANRSVCPSPGRTGRLPACPPLKAAAIERPPCASDASRSKLPCRSCEAVLLDDVCWQSRKQRLPQTWPQHRI